MSVGILSMALNGLVKLIKQSTWNSVRSVQFESSRYCGLAAIR
jgi:hypothetical protein